MDLATLLLISCLPKVTENELESFFQTYFEAFSKICSDHNTANLWTDYEDFRKEVDPKINLFGLLWCVESYEVLTHILK